MISKTKLLHTNKICTPPVVCSAYLSKINIIPHQQFRHADKLEADDMERRTRESSLM